MSTATDAAATTPGAESEGLPGIALAGLLMACAQAPLGSTMIAVALPSIGKELGLELTLVTAALVTSYLIANIIGQSPGGKLGDAFGHARTARIGMALCAAGACIGLFGKTLALLVLARCSLAFGGALIVPSTIALLRLYIPAERRGRVFGMVGATMGLSAAIGPPLGGELVTVLGWRAIFGASFVLVAVAALLSTRAQLPARVTQPATLAQLVRRFDYAGSLLMAISLCTLVVGSKAGPDTRAWLLCAGVAIAVVFVRWELRSKDPVLDPRLFRQPAFAAGSLIIALQNVGMYGLIFQLPLFFTDHRGANASDVGRVLFPMTISMFLASPLGGRLTDRLGARSVVLMGSVPILFGMFWLHRIAQFQSPHDTILPLSLLGFGIGLTGAPAQTAAMSSVAVERSGMAAGATSTMRYVGGVVSMVLLAAILGGTHGVHPAIAAHEHAVSAFTVALCCATGMAFLLPSK